MQTTHIISGYVSLTTCSQCLCQCKQDQNNSNQGRTQFLPADLYMCVSVPYCFHSLSAQTFANVMEGADSVRLVGAISGLQSVFQSFSEDTSLPRQDS